MTEKLNRGKCIFRFSNSRLLIQEVRQIFDEPYNNVIFILVMKNANAKMTLAKHDEFLHVVEDVIKSKKIIGIERISEFTESCFELFPDEISTLFPFIPDLLDYCHKPSTAYMFKHYINMNDAKPEILDYLLDHNRYDILNELDEDSEFLESPSVVWKAINDQKTIENWRFLSLLAKSQPQLPNLLELVSDAIAKIEIGDTLTTVHTHNDEVFTMNQVFALNFITEIIYGNPICVTVVDLDLLFSLISKILTKFKKNTFAMKAISDFLKVSFIKKETQAYFHEKIFPILFSFFEKDENSEERIIIGIFADCIQSLISEDCTLNDILPETVKKKFDEYSKLTHI
ncbi:hypothetical protein TRFO_33700 [Tritrichomonas foetus]|uniref:Uncharacterized protein n=1 Tax=Tritrichomonas foetus TaxID=1144522 RepID=A0A1J4JQI4_9EUKA|nr:hypothetical protein TRFO_33700 [Tritrichomonas foetus]|eukprot:OHS99781.1 hypothetical protein TRFO_33700 [Tritrichomonas foetus]